MKLYYHPLSTYCHKVMIAFKEKGVSFDGEIVELMDPKGREDYRKIYPIGKIPFLVLDNGHKIPESTIIIEYLENTYDQGTRLIPSDKDQARQARFHDRMIDLYFINPLGSIFFDSLKPENERQPEMVTQWRETIDNVYGFMNQHLGENPWINGKDFSLADCAAAPALHYAKQTHPFEQHKNIVAYWNRLTERPSIQAVLKEVQPSMEAFLKAQSKG